jgi:hypothetical protein
MPNVSITLDSENFMKLSALALEERRAIPMQAEVLLLQALGRWPMPDISIPSSRHQAPVESRG